MTKAEEKKAAEAEAKRIADEEAEAEAKRIADEEAEAKRIADEEAEAEAKRIADEGKETLPPSDSSPVNGAPAPVHDPLGLSVMSMEEKIRMLMSMDETAANGFLIDTKQENLQGAMISGVKEVFAPYPFRPNQTVIVTIMPENGDLTVRISKGAVKANNKGAKHKVNVTSPQGVTETADSAAEYVRTHDGLDEKTGSAVKYLRDKGYKVEDVEE